LSGNLNGWLISSVKKAQQHQRPPPLKLTQQGGLNRRKTNVSTGKALIHFAHGTGARIMKLNQRKPLALTKCP
jgi:hypothetical protein